jgi:hypothetical protein
VRPGLYRGAVCGRELVREGAGESTGCCACNCPAYPGNGPACASCAQSTNDPGRSDPAGAKAQLVKLPPPRAQLIRLPEWKIDESHPVILPYGTEVLAALRGYLGSETQLPRVGHVGDTWAIGDNLWVWITAPGASNATWIDP